MFTCSAAESEWAESERAGAEREGFRIVSPYLREIDGGTVREFDDWVAMDRRAPHEQSEWLR